MPKYRGREKPIDNRGKGDAANDPDVAKADQDVYWTVNGGPAGRGGVNDILPPVGLIEAEGHDPFNGVWCAQYFDRPAGIRYSIGYTPDKRFFVLCVNDLTRAIEWRWFETAGDVRRSNLPDALKRRPDSSNRFRPVAARTRPVKQRKET